MRMAALPNDAEAPQMRMSAASTRARPPPTAGPFTAAMTGWGSERSSSGSDAIISWKRRRSMAGSVASGMSGPKSRRSMPEQKPRPVPVRTTARTVGSEAMAAQASRRPVMVVWSMALSRRGRLRRSSVTPSPPGSTTTDSFVGMGRIYPTSDLESGVDFGYRAHVSYELPVEYGKVREFARATQTANPAYWSSDPVIPPTFLTTGRLVWEPPEENQTDALEFDLRRILHGEEEFVFHGPLPRAGQTLTVSTRVDATWEKEGKRGGVMRFARIINEFRDTEGALRAEQITTVLETAQAPKESE